MSEEISHVLDAVHLLASVHSTVVQLSRSKSNRGEDHIRVYRLHLESKRFVGS